MIEAAGILFIANGKVLLLKRSADSDHPREWCVPGGKLEEGETPESAARREFSEECGNIYNGDLDKISYTENNEVCYTTFLAVLANEFTPILDHEHTAFMWCEPDDIPNKTHPGVKELLASNAVCGALFGSDDAKLSDAEFEHKYDTERNAEESRADSAEVITETDIAKKIRDGVLTSPQKFGNVTLFALRISGTGISYRSKINEYVNRLPENYLTEEFLERCNGLFVIWIHPENDRLDSDSFKERVIGAICLPYIKDSDVWGIAQIRDEEAAQMMQQEQMSTSPGVVFQPGTNEKMQLSDGSHVLIEGKPFLLDHLAVVENGVWDKGGEPSGVLNDSQPAHVEMTEASRMDSESPVPTLNKEPEMPTPEDAVTPENEILALLKGLVPKIEAMEARLSAIEADESVELEAKPEVVPSAAAALPSPELPVAGVKAPVVAKADVEQAPIPEIKSLEPLAIEKPALVADAEYKARMDAIEKDVAAFKDSMKEPAPEEKEKLAEAQGKLDAVEHAYGDSAPRPLFGDTPMAYEKRNIQKHLTRSKRWSGVNVSAITDPAAFAIIRDEVYADSMKAAHSCEGLKKDEIRAVKKVDGGCETTTFIGKASFVSGLSQKPM